MTMSGLEEMEELDMVVLEDSLVDVTEMVMAAVEAMEVEVVEEEEAVLGELVELEGLVE